MNSWASWSPDVISGGGASYAGAINAENDKINSVKNQLTGEYDAVPAVARAYKVSFSRPTSYPTKLPWLAFNSQSLSLFQMPCQLSHEHTRSVPLVPHLLQTSIPCLSPTPTLSSCSGCFCEAQAVRRPMPPIVFRISMDHMPLTRRYSVQCAESPVCREH